MYSMLSNPSTRLKSWKAAGAHSAEPTCESALFPNEMTLFVDGAAPSTMYNLICILKSPEETAHLTMHFGEFFPFFFLTRRKGTP
jgi:hypothetical protein